MRRMMGYSPLGIASTLRFEPSNKLPQIVQVSFGQRKLREAELRFNGFGICDF